MYFSIALLVSAVLSLSACTNLTVKTPSASASMTLNREAIAQIIASPDRSAADRINDQRRKPEQMLAFIGLRPGMTALDLSLIHI